MEPEKIAYRSGFKYQLAADYVCRVPVSPFYEIASDFLELTFDWCLTIKAGYAWDGPSGPAIDTKNFMRGSLVHDALYQLMRNGHLDRKYRGIVDKELYRICREDGMWPMRAGWVYLGVKYGAGAAADPKSKKKIQIAP